MGFVKVAKASEFNGVKCKQVELEDKGLAVALYLINGKFYAMNGTCPHVGGPLGEGDLDGNVVTCPWHGWTFDVMTGNCVIRPGVRQATYEVKVEGDDILVRFNT